MKDHYQETSFTIPPAHHILRVSYIEARKDVAAAFGLAAHAQCQISFIRLLSQLAKTISLHRTECVLLYSMCDSLS